MSEWWSYRPSSFLLFAPETYFRLFQLTNEAVWPLQIAVLVAALALAALVWRGASNAGRVIAVAVACAWAWVGWSFVWQRYAPINWAAAYVAPAFALQSLLLLFAAARGTLDYRGGLRSLRACVGIAVFWVAVVLQPLLAPLLGRPWLQVEIVGLAPDPTAVATLGLLIAADRVRWSLLAIPLLWCFATAITLWTMRTPDALVTPLLAMVAVAAALTLRSGKNASARP